MTTESKETVDENTKRGASKREFIKTLAGLGLGAAMAQTLYSSLNPKQRAQLVAWAQTYGKPMTYAELGRLIDAAAWDDVVRAVRYQPASYIIYQAPDGSYQAKNGNTGQIEFSGTDAASVIQQALNALPTGRTWKERVVVKGNFMIYSQILIPSYTVLDCRGAYFKNAGNTNIFVIKDTKVTDVEIYGGVYDGNAQNQPDTTKANAAIFLGINTSASNVAERIIIEGIYAFNWLFGGIVANYCENLTIRDVITKNTGLVYNGTDFPHGLYIDQSHDVLIDGHISVSDGSQAANNPSAAVKLSNGSRYTYINGFIINSGTYIPGANGILLNNLSQSTIANNVIVGSRDNGIMTLSANELTIKGNKIYSVVNNGIRVSDQSFENSVLNNEISQCGWGILIETDFNIIEDNYIYKNNYQGIRVFGSHNLIKGNYVLNNSQASPGTYEGIQLYKFGGGNNYNNVEGNIVRGATFHNYGINISTGTGNRIFGNDLYSAGLSPLVDSGTNTLVIDNRGYNPQGFNIKTPAMPASGTAQGNTFPFPVIVYLYGGTVTQITINGQVVFSSGTGISLTGQSFTLNPGDTIAITYTAAPTWKWYGL